MTIGVAQFPFYLHNSWLLFNLTSALLNILLYLFCYYEMLKTYTLSFFYLSQIHREFMFLPFVWFCVPLHIISSVECEISQSLVPLLWVV